MLASTTCSRRGSWDQRCCGESAARAACRWRARTDGNSLGPPSPTINLGRRLKVKPAAKTASPRPPEEAAIGGPFETAPTAPGGTGRCRLRLVPSLTAGWCHVGGGASVDGAPGVFAAGVRAVLWPPPERASQGPSETVGGARLRLGTSGTFPPATSWAAP